MNTELDTWALLLGLTPLNADADLIELKDFIEYVQEGGFIDYDGNGCWATDKYYLNKFDLHVYPSQIRNGETVPPDWATHVVWYNR